MVQLSFKVQGATQLSRNLRVFAKDIQELSPFFEEALDIISARSDAVFAATGSNVEKAGGWPPLSASTKRARERRWGYYKRSPSRPSVLRWTGNLQDKRDRHVTDSGGRLTFLMPYAGFHQKGGGKLPKRVIVDLSNPTNELIVKALQKRIHQVAGIFGRQV